MKMIVQKLNPFILEVLFVMSMEMRNMPEYICLVSVNVREIVLGHNR